MTSSMNPEIPVSKTVSLPCEKNTRLRLADLLISVRDQEELLEVRKSEAQIIDLKEPDDGPLAPADPALWRFAADLWQRSQTSTVTSLSAALGEQDADKRLAMYLELQTETQAEAPFVIMFQAIKQVAMRDNIKGYVNGATSDYVFYRLVEKE